MNKYEEFIATKERTVQPSGFAPDSLPEWLYDFQGHMVSWALEQGKAAIFADCGLGKTPCQLAWADMVASHQSGKVLVITPLAVSHQTVREGTRFGVDVTHSRTGETGRITATNYERLHYFKPSDFVGVVLDECFPPETPIDVFTIDGHTAKKYIKDIRRGDSIINAQGKDHVSEIYKRQINRAVQIRINEKTITCSENHPFFTLHGWRCAQDLQPGDYIMATATAVCLVRNSLSAEIHSLENATVLREILLSEMENEHTGACSEGSHEGGACEDREKEIGVVQKWKCNGVEGTEKDKGTEPHKQPGNEKEDICCIAENEAQTFRAWGKWSINDIATANNDGCIIRKLDCGISYITGKTSTRFSNVLQGRLRESRIEDRIGDRRQQPSCSKISGHEKGYKVGYSRVDGVKILERGCPELEKYRDADGLVYFYDIKAARHPSFSVNGLLVHNSSILKNYSGSTRQAITDFMRTIPYRLLCTATPAPNDHMELGTSAEALGVMRRVEMLAVYFTHNSNDTQNWVLKGHAEKPFWAWMASWSRACRKPSDLGYDDGKFILPDLHMIQHTLPSAASDGMLFAMEAKTLNEQRAERRRTLEDRCAKVAELANATKEPFLCWCSLNDESATLASMIPGAVEVCGSDTDEHKERSMLGFSDGSIRVLITKPSIAGFGMNWQHCNQMSFFPSHSHEQFYQATRRCWRFGQEKEVTCHIVTTEAECMVLDNMKRKEKLASKMFAGIIDGMKEFQGQIKKTDYNPTVKMELPAWLNA